jgi:hypothetical protein
MSLMKHLSLLAAALLVAAPLGAARADTTFLPAQTDSEYLAKDHLIGSKIHGPDGKIVADVEDLIINGDNLVVGVVMGVGGYLGFAEKKVGVPLTALKFEEKDGAIFVSLPDATKEALDSAPAYERKQPAKSLFERAKEKVDELSDKTKSSTEDAYEKAKPTIDDAKQKASEAYDKAKDAVSGAVDAAKNAYDGTSTPAGTPPADTTTPPADSTTPPADSTTPAPAPVNP